jgi:glucuronate isomerase
MKEFLGEDFLLQSDTGRELYHEYAKSMPIFDYHCHLPPQQIAENAQFQNLTQIWLYGDHYKWRAMRTNGVAERFCTGDAPDYDKFLAFAETVPSTIGNPLYHWTHLELKRYFGISGTLLDPSTAAAIWSRCNEQLATDEFRVRPLIERMNVKLVCTTDDPADSLEHHDAVARVEGLKVKVLPAFRPDKAMAVETGRAYVDYVERLGHAAGVQVRSFNDLLDALSRRHEFFHSKGCRLTDHGIYLPVFEPAGDAELDRIFRKVLGGDAPGEVEDRQVKTAVLLHVGRLNAKRGWTMQLHMGAIRNNNTRMFRALGPDTGFDAITDGDMARPLSRFLDALDQTGELPRTVLYVLNPRDNELIAAMIGCFQDGSVPGKIQFGSGWWFNDQKDGMMRQMTALSSMGLLSRFVGMLTDSRSFLSYPRHEYFRRLLCNLIGGWVDEGEAPRDMALLGRMVQDICYNNAARYFEMGLEG